MLGVPARQLDDLVVSVLCQSVSGVHRRGEPAVARLQLIEACIGFCPLLSCLLQPNVIVTTSNVRCRPKALMRLVHHLM